MVIGIIGGGQLAKMMILAGYPMGQEFVVLDPAPDAAAGRVARQIIGDYDDLAKLDELAALADVVTFDFENVPAKAVEHLQKKVSVFPSMDALAVSQDRIDEKRLFNQHGIKTADFRCVDDLAGLKNAINDINLPAVLKTRRMGYDGKGQFVIHSKTEIENAWNAIGQQPAILEAMVNFEKEVSLICVRNLKGETAFYPLVQNVHSNGILNISTAPYDNEALQIKAQSLVTPLLQSLYYVGVLTMEFFVEDGELIANEMAPRVHNSGHWTIEGASVSQFENHLRAILGLPLGSTVAHSHAAMINFLSQMPKAEDVLQVKGCHFHDYGKEAKPGRKLGHATLRASSPEKLQSRIETLTDIINRT